MCLYIRSLTPQLPSATTPFCSARISSSYPYYCDNFYYSLLRGFQELSRRIATAARAPIVVGDVFQDEAAGEVQLRYMASMDGAPLDKAARTHEKLRTLSELLAPFTSPEREEGITPLTIEVGF